MLGREAVPMFSGSTPSVVFYTTLRSLEQEKGYINWIGDNLRTSPCTTRLNVAKANDKQERPVWWE